MTKDRENWEKGDMRREKEKPYINREGCVRFAEWGKR